MFQPHVVKEGQCHHVLSRGVASRDTPSIARSGFGLRCCSKRDLSTSLLPSLLLFFFFFTSTSQLISTLPDMPVSCWMPGLAKSPEELISLGCGLATEVRSALYHYYFHSHTSPWSVLAISRDVFLLYIIGSYGSRIVTLVRGKGLFASVSDLIDHLSRAAFKFFLALPLVRDKVDQQVSEATEKMQLELMKNDASLLQFPTLPSPGLPEGEVSLQLGHLLELKHSDWQHGRVSGAVYHGGKDLLQMQANAYAQFLVANQLHPDVFPGVRKMDAEVVAMVSSLFHSPSSCGTTTSGGTELLLLAGLAAREFGAKYKGIRHPEVIAPITVHAGIEKACSYFKMTLHKVEVDPVLFQVNIAKVKRLINKNTVLLVGSAPNFPHGIIDDIESLSKLAVQYQIPLHVDACLGSFVIPFLQELGVHGKKPIPLFDFRLPGVTSISCDTHKYGFAPKGSSILMYRDRKLRECQYYVLADWTGGMYGSPTLAGSRPGALIAGCWATLVHIGRKGYVESCIEIVQTMLKFKRAIETDLVLSKHLTIIGDPIGPVLAFQPRHRDLFDIYKLGDILTLRGWHFSALQRPAALHFSFTKLTVPIIGEMIADLIECTLEVAQSPAGGTKGDNAVLYGVAGSIKTAGVADRLIVAFLDTLYKL